MISPRLAAAAAPEDAAAAEAKRHYEEGTKAFNLGEFGRAIAEFKATYNVKPDPLLLYNIAQSYRLAGDANQALFFYKSFLRNMPAATNRKDVEAQIRKLEKQIEDQKREGPPTAGAGAVAPPPVMAAPTTPQPAESVAAAPLTSPARPSVHPSPPPTRAVTESTRAAPPVLVPAAPPPESAPQVDVTIPAPSADHEEDRPIYKKWWFWAGAAGAVLIIGGIAAANAKKAPNTTLGTYDPEFK